MSWGGRFERLDSSTISPFIMTAWSSCISLRQRSIVICTHLWFHSYLATTSD
jgi:hypothetical protein